MTRTFTNIVVCLMTVAITFLCFTTDTQAQVPEDFETFPTGTASANGWTIDPTTGFRWEAEDASGANENSLDTGPFFDHTSEGTAGGFYMYTEASSGSAGDEANFVSPAIDLSTYTCPKLSFWYHMFGADMGELHIDANDGSGWVLDVIPPIVGQQHGTGDAAWSEATGSLAAYQGQTAVQIRFRAIRGASFESDISIDDVDIVDDTSDDIGIIGVSATPAFCDHGDAEAITVTIANNSCVDVAANSVDVTLDVTGPANTGPVTETIPDMIPAGGSVDYTFAATVDMLAGGTYLIDVAAAFNAGSGLTDGNAANDTFGGGLTLGSDFGSIDGENPAYVESFEAGDGGWNVLDAGGNSNMILGTPDAAATNINSASDGTQAWFHNGSAYNANEAIFFISGCYDLGCMETGTFSIDVNFDSEGGWDGASVGYSTDDGATFTRLGDDTTGTNWYNDDSVNSQDIFGDTNGPGWSGDCDSGDTGCSGAWLAASHPIDMLAGEPAVLFAITFTSDGSVQTGDGFAWDNVQVTGTTDAACFGCADVGACNFDGSPYDDGVTCEYTSCAGCMDAGACNYDAAATIDDGSCDYSCLGCMDATACNFDAAATIDDGSCNFGTCGDGVCDLDCGEDVTGCADCANTVLGCMDAAACNYDPNATNDDGSCEFTSCAGCTNAAACNYDAAATIDDGSCIVGSCGNGVCELACGENASNCNDCLIRSGCTDPLAHNFSPRANQDDGSCETCTDGIMNGDETDIDCGGSLCGPCAGGCTDVDAHNYDANALVDDGSCETCSDGIQNGDETGVDCGGANSNCGDCGDLCINALDIACGDSMLGDTNNNTADDLPALCSNGIGFGISNPGAGAWYTFEGTGENAIISTDNPGTSLDTNLQLFSGDCDNLVCEFSDEDGGFAAAFGFSSIMDFPTTAGVTYYIYVSGYNGGQGAYELTLDCYFPIVITPEVVFPIPNGGGGVGGVDVTVSGGGNLDCGSALTYAWTGPGGYTASTEDAADITMAGDYTLTVTDCLNNTETYTVNVAQESRSGRGRKAAIIASADLTATPNPFTNQTMISFQVNTQERVSLEVFDIRGAKVASLFNDTAEAGQNYQAQFGKNIPAGTYIAKLTTTNGEVQHIKLVLTK